MAVTNFYVGGKQYSSKRLWRIQDDGNSLSIITSIDLSNDVNYRSLAIGPSGGIFVGEGTQVHKYDNTFSLDASWGTGGSIDVGGTVYGVALDASGRLIVPHDYYAAEAKNIRLFDSSGSETWGVMVAFTSYHGRISSFCVDGKILAGFHSSSTGQCCGRRLDDSDGSGLNEYMCISADGHVLGVVSNPANTKVYTAWKDDDYSRGRVRGYPINGTTKPTENWKNYYSGNSVYGLILHSNGYIYVFGQNSPSIRKLDASDGSEKATYNTGSILWDVCEDDNGNIVTVGYYANNQDGHSVNINVLDEDLTYLRGLAIGAIQLHAVAAKLEIPATAPVITDQSGDTTVLSGAVTTLFITASGSPAPTYQWYKNGFVISGETETAITIYPTSTATYKCIVTNAIGSDTSDDIVVTIVANPYTYDIFDMQLDIDRS